MSIQTNLFRSLYVFLAILFLYSWMQPSPIFAQTQVHPYEVPLYFEKNEGQTDSKVEFLSRGPGHTFFFTPEEIVLVLQNGMGESVSSSSLKIKFLGAKENPIMKGLDLQECKSHYFIGNDPAKWRRGVSNFAKVAYEEIYPGIDAVFYGNGRQFEYDLNVSPKGNPQNIRLSVEGAKSISIGPNGDLTLLTHDEQAIHMQKPLVYQEGASGEKNKIAGEFILLAQNQVGFRVGSYDTTRLLVIDPVLVYSTYLGGSGNDQGASIVVDSSGNAYVTGFTQSTNFPTTAGAFQSSIAPSAKDAFITKFNASGSGLLYSTYLGGSTDLGGGNNTQGTAIALDEAGNIYVTGSTSASNFPVQNAYQTTIGESGSPGASTVNAFLTVLNPSGSSLVYSTYLGGTGSADGANALAVDSSSNAYLTGQTSSTNFPVTAGAFQTTYPGGSQSAFAAKFNTLSSGVSSLVYSTYLGGNTKDQGNGIAIDGEGNAYVAGFTGSSNFPTTAGAFQTVNKGFGGGFQNVFVTKLNPSGTGLVYSTYLGGSTGLDKGEGIALDSQGNAFIGGQTASNDFPVTAGAFQTIYGGGSDDAFVAKLNPSGSALIYSTYLGGIGDDEGKAITIDSTGHAYIVGLTNSANFPVTANALQRTFTGAAYNAFIARLNPDGSDILYSSYFGGTGGSNANKAFGVALDSTNLVYVTGLTQSTNMPVTPGAFQTVYGGGSNDAFVAKFLVDATTSTTLSVSPNPAIKGMPVTLTATITPFAGSPSSLTGSVAFYDGLLLIGVENLSNGTASITYTPLMKGSHFLIASYSGDTVYQASNSLVVPLEVLKK